MIFASDSNVIFFVPGAKNIFRSCVLARAMKNASVKKTVWENIYRLIIPYRKRFLWVVALGLLSTGASLVEPLIYREAINDVAGLFVRHARLNAHKDLGVDPGEADSIQSMIRSELPDTASAAPIRPVAHRPE